MGTYFNPDNASFQEAVRSRIYVDKTELLALLNSVLKTSEKCISLSHARRFGKSQAAGMIDAYYSKGSDSRSLFAPFAIANAPDFEEHLNKYNVIHLDISSFADFHKEDLVETVIDCVFDEMKTVYPGIDYGKPIAKVLASVFEISGTPFVIIVDEWDCVVRNHADRPDLVHKYLQFLHSLFKSEESKSFLALAYVTGILPIKKVRDESALNNFREFTMADSKKFTPYFGFTEDEVQGLCALHGMDYASVRQWYDGYRISGWHMYNPHSVFRALLEQSLESYWRNTSAFETINDLVTLDFEGLKEDVLDMLSGGHAAVNVRTFQNDLSCIRSKDEALTALIHLGYLGYDADRKEAYVPNYEVREAFQSALVVGAWDDVAKTISRCDDLLRATENADAAKVAELVELAHTTYSSVLQFNDENALSCALTMAYFTAPAYYTIVREMPAGKGFADMAFIPRREAGCRPAMIVELKWNAAADTAILQIRERRYAGALAGHKGPILLVGIAYDKNSTDKTHDCVIESVDLR